MGFEGRIDIPPRIYIRLQKSETMSMVILIFAAGFLPVVIDSSSRLYYRVGKISIQFHFAFNIISDFPLIVFLNFESD